MRVTKEIRKAAEDYERQYMTHPKVVYMSSFTLDTIKNETAAVWKVNYPGGIDKVFGMKIVVKEFLPIGVVVVGGVVHDATEDLQKELEELEERVAIMSEGRPDIYCKDCKFFKVQDWWVEDGAMKFIGANQVPTCTKWANGCKTNPDGYCHLAERKITNE